MAASSCGVLLGLEAGVAGADGGFAEALARLERADVVGDLLALVHELGVGLIRPMSCSRLIFGLPGLLLREPGDQAHDVVVVDDGGGEEDELEIELVDRSSGWLCRRPCPAAP